MPNHNRRDSWILILAGLAVLAKIYCASTTFGTDDVALYYYYGKVVAERGLEGALALPQFNLPPLLAWSCAFLFKAVESNNFIYPFLLRLPGIVSSFGSVLILHRLRQRYPEIPAWGLVLFAVSPVAFMVDGFHGNLDSILVFFLLLSGFACVMERPSWWLSGLFLVVATQIKVLALLLSPILFFFWWHRGQGLRFFALVSTGVLLGWLPGLLAAPVPFLQNVLAYGSVWGIWGITYFLHLSGLPEFSTVHWVGLTPAQVLVSHALKILIVGAIILMGWRRRKLEGTALLQTCAFAWILFFTLSPGMGMQYLVWFAPFVLIWDVRWFATLIGVCSTVMFAYYTNACGGIPWNHADSTKAFPHPWLLTLPWVAFLACSIACFRRIWMRSPDDSAISGQAGLTSSSMNGSKLSAGPLTRTSKGLLD